MIKLDSDFPGFPLNSEKTTDGIRVVLCSYPGLFSDAVIDQLMQNTEIKMTGLVYSQRIYSANESWFSGAIRMVKTSGIDYAILQFLQTDCYLFARKLLLNKKIEQRIPVLRTKNINTKSGFQFLKKLNPEFILLANFNQKVSSAIISIPSLACLNIHPSMLPKYKGVDPVFAAMYANETALGVTVHLVDDDFDTGDILAQAEMAADKHFSVFFYQLQLFREGGKLAAQKIKQLSLGTARQIKNADGHYDSWPTQSKIREFKKNGGRLVRISEYLSALKEALGER